MGENHLILAIQKPFGLSCKLWQNQIKLFWCTFAAFTGVA